MSKELELYQQELSMAFKPIFSRFNHYQKIIYELRNLLESYFFNAIRIKKLEEVAPQGNEMVFNFSHVKDAMASCLIDEKQLIEVARRTMDSAEQPDIAAVFDLQIANSGLPIKFHKKKRLYIFKPEQPYQSNAQAFMEQFVYSLGLYRICLSVYEIYSTLLNHPGIQIQHLRNHIDSAQDLQQLVSSGEGDIIALYKHVKSLKKEILSLLNTKKIYEGINAFKEDIDKLASELVVVLGEGAVHLQNYYKLFPNNPILWMLHDRGWHTLLKTIAALLYDGQYTYSTLYGSLQIKREFMELIKNEIEHFGSIGSVKIPMLKIELLRKAAKLITVSKIDLLAKLANQGVVLMEAPKLGIFASASPNVYQLMAAIYKRKLENPELEADDDRRELFPKEDTDNIKSF